jgi:hypothetical protein
VGKIFLFKTHDTVARHFEDALRMREKTVRGAGAAVGTFKIMDRKNCRYLLLILTEDDKFILNFSRILGVNS